MAARSRVCMLAICTEFKLANCSVLKPATWSVVNATICAEVIDVT